MPEPTGVTEPALIAIAHAALLEIAPAVAVGEFAGAIEEADRVVSLQFTCLLPGYPGWRWTVSVAQLDGLEPSVLEAELLPAEGALLAPDWVPWSERLAEWKAAQEAAALAAAAEGAEDDVEHSDDDSDDEGVDDADDDDSDDDAEDDDDFDDESPRRTHGGDLDGVDIDEVIDDEGDSD